jgi:hypothetical protein
MSAPITPTCHPDRPHYARKLCRTCYSWKQQAERLDEHPRLNFTSVTLAARAQALRAELEAAGAYAAIPCTWPAIARHLGVAPKTLEKARQRARRYAEREAAA